MPIDISTLGYYNSLAKFGMPVGSQKSINIDLSVTDCNISTPCRQFSATSGSVLFVDLTTKDGVDSHIPIAPFMPIVNVTRVYKEGTDCTNVRGWPVD